MRCIMLKKVFDYFKNFDKITYKILNYGLKFCFIIGIVSAFILLSYLLLFTSPTLYYIGIYLFKLCLILAIEFIICSFVVDGIKKQLI